MEMPLDGAYGEQKEVLWKKDGTSSIIVSRNPGREKTENDSKEGREENERDKGHGSEKIPFLLETQEVLLTPAQEEEIVGPVSFTWCGLGCFKSEWLQKLARPEAYLIAFSLAAMAQGIFFSYTTGTISTVERRFKLPSTASGIISTGNDVLQLFVSLHLSYVAGNGHRPRWLGGGLLLAATGCFLVMTPHLIFGAGDYSDLYVDQSNITDNTSENKKEWASCGRGSKEEDCQGESSSVGVEQYAVSILQFLGQVMSGLANVCFYVVGYSYLDEAVNKDKVPLYFAISGCMRIFGPVMGMALSGYALGVWIESGVEPVIQPSHPRWVGAWWLGYPIMILILIATAVPMLMMPRQLPGARKRTLVRLRAAAKKGNEALTAYKDSLRPIGKIQFRNIWEGLRRLYRRKIFVAILLNQTFFWFAVVGYFMFSLKYMEHQFKIPAAEANKSMALAGIIASLIGWLGMGSILTLLKPSPKIIMMLNMTITVLTMANYLAQTAITCERDHVLGLDAVLETENSMIPPQASRNDEEVSTCMSSCNCSTQYSPVCGDTTHLFFSACHAGCTQQLNVNGSLMFKNCPCMDLLASTTSEGSSSSIGPVEVKSGPCYSGCSKFTYYVILNVLAQMLISSNRVISNVIVFRSVDERDKDLALGLLNVLLSAAFVLNPILIGGLVDFSCILWQRTCGRRGFCYLYDMEKFKWILHGIPVFGLAFVFLTEALLLRWHEEMDFFGLKELEDLQLFDLLRRKKKKKKKREDKEEEEKQTLKGDDNTKV